ncbi:MAG: M1 family metallopeptidase [Planctomycetota bacterium]|jgi:hypothetical protein
MRGADGKDLWKEGTMRYVSPDDGNRKDRTLAQVTLPQPVPPGETITLRIEFLSRLPRVQHRTGWSGDPDKPDSLFFMVAQWFPKIAVLRRGPDGRSHWNARQFHRNSEFFSDYGVYKVSLRAPSGFVIGATGRRISGPLDNGDGTVTVIHEQADVHDFAWTASPHFDVHESIWSFDRFLDEAPEAMAGNIRELWQRTARHLGVEPDAIKPQREVTMRLLLQPDHDRVAARFRNSAGASLACYGLWFGEYPYDVLTVVDPPEGGGAAGGMEYPTLITVWGDRTAPDYRRGMEGVTIHEFGHQYFYGLLGSNEFDEAWLDEGFTSFTTSRVSDVAYGPGSTNTRYGPVHTPYDRPFAPPAVFPRIKQQLRLGAAFKWVPESWRNGLDVPPVPQASGFWEYMRDMPALHLDDRVAIPNPAGSRSWVLGVHSHDPIVMPGRVYASRRDYGVNSYGKPTVFLYCLRGLMGEAAFDRAMRSYATSYRFRHPRTTDFLKEVHAHAPARTQELLDGFLYAMLETASRLDVAILSAEQEELGNSKWLYRVRVQRRGDIPVPIQLFADGEPIATWHSQGRETTRTFVSVRDKPFRAVRIGPEWLTYIDSDITNNARVADDGADRRPAVVTAARWSLYMEECVRSYAGLAR